MTKGIDARDSAELMWRPFSDYNVHINDADYRPLSVR